MARKTFIGTIRSSARGPFWIALGVVASIVLLLYGVAQFGMITPLSDEKHIERDRQSSRLVITQDKDGCIDARTLGRSNGVYMALAPCKPGDKDKDKPKTPPQQPQQK